MSADIVYPYKANSRLLAFLPVIFLAAGLFFFGRAIENPTSLVVLKGWELSRVQSIVFYWLSAGLCGAIAVLGIVLIAHRLRTVPEIRLREKDLIYPFRFSRNPISIPYAAILSLEQGKVPGAAGGQLLWVRTADKTFAIGASMLPNSQAFEEVSRRLHERVSANNALENGRPRAGADQRGR